MRELAEAGTASKELQDMYAGLQETPQPAPISGSVQTDNSEVLTVDITKEELAELVSSTVTSAMKAAETPAEEETPEESTAPEVEKSVSDEPVAEAAPSTADFAKAVAEAVKEALAPVTARLEVVENQPEAPRVLINASGLGSTPVAVMRGQTGTPADQMVKALGDQIATTTDPARKAQLNNELSRIRLRAFEEMRNAGFPAQP
jgi:hypothetical protein